VQGSLGGEYLRRSLDLVSWEAAQDRVRGWEASGEVGVNQSCRPDDHQIRGGDAAHSVPGDPRTHA
jgi:hypothetical protein